MEWLQGWDLNPRPLGYEPNELPDCSTLRQDGYLNGGRGGTRTLTPFYRRWILSPLCLPIPPLDPMQDTAELLAFKYDAIYILLHIFRICQVFLKGSAVWQFILDQRMLFGVIFCSVGPIVPQLGRFDVFGQTRLFPNRWYTFV